MDQSKIDEIRKAIENKKLNVKSDNPFVEITEIITEAVRLLADDKNEVFSEHFRDRVIGVDETQDFGLLSTFAVRPLPFLEETLRRKGIKRKMMSKTIVRENGVETIKEVEDMQDIRYECKDLQYYLADVLRRRHSVNRGRVKEYIDALDAGRIKEVQSRNAPGSQQERLTGRIA